MKKDKDPCYSQENFNKSEEDDDNYLQRLLLMQLFRGINC